jgi:delta(3,5)-delta(2,4)-dienoyl-CoA isomerase
MSLEFKTLAVSVSATGVCHVELNRPKRLNAMSNEFFSELGQCFRAIARNADIRVVVLSAAGRMFTAGLDLGDVAFLMQDMEVSRKAAFVRQHVAG